MLITYRDTKKYSRNRKVAGIQIPACTLNKIHSTRSMSS